MTGGIGLAVELKSMVAAAEAAAGLGVLDVRSRDIIYFVAQREMSGTETAVSHVILNENFGSLGTVQRHLYALIADRWLEARAAEGDARRKDIRLGPRSREALAAMSALLKQQLAAHPARSAPTMPELSPVEAMQGKHP